MEKEINNNHTRIKEFLKSKRFLRPLTAVLIGGLAGFLYYYFIGCNSGSCRITSDPFMSIFWGGLLGFFLMSR